VYAHQAKPFTAIRSSRFASTALTATDVRLDRALIADFKSSRILRHFYDFACQLMT
jgi:hypothetical protein